MSVLERLDRAAGATACQALQWAGGGLISSAVWNLTSFSPYGIAVRLGFGAASLLAANYGCPEFEVGEDFNPSDPGNCQKVDGVGTLQILTETLGWQDVDDANAHSFVTAIVKYEILDPPPHPDSTRRIWYNTTKGNGLSYVYKGPMPNGDEWQFRINPDPGSSCIEGGGQPNPPLFPPEPIQYFDEVTNCYMQVTPLGFANRSATPGQAGMVFLIEEANPETRASGGRMGGCNFAPTIYYGGGGGDGNPPYYVPAPDGRDDGDDGVPWWVPPLVYGAADLATDAILAALANGEEPQWPDTEYLIEGVCEEPVDGKQPVSTTPVGGGYFGDTVIARLDAMQELIQFNLNYKTPICTPTRPALEGQWITTQWESDEKMVASGNRLRKLFRYRTKSTRDLGQLSAYWESFTWTSGPVVVRHTGAWWGDPQVWASSEEEGKRVIRFAAAEAGIDPDQAGEWAVSSSRSPRYGMPGTMRIKRFEGFPWVAKRDGSDWPNMLAKQRDP